MNLKQYPKRLDSKISTLRITVPENLDLALEGLIRKVLREQPKTDDIYSFAANYFETLLRIRDKAGANITPGQLCPFHNDEDAHEMIKIAGTFPKPDKIRKSDEDLSKTGKKKRVEDQLKKDVRHPKPKQTVKDKKVIKQSTPDLIKKLPNARENKNSEVGKTNPDEQKKPETIDEKVEIDGEFLTSDPIKELVEKELMLEGKGKQKEGVPDEKGFDAEKEKEELRIDEKVDTKPEVEATVEPRNAEETQEKTPKVAVESIKNTETATPSLSPHQKMINNKAEVTTEAVKPETQFLSTVEEESTHPEKTAKDELPLVEVSDKENKTPTAEIKNVEHPETSKQEEKIENATGEKQPEAEIDKETKATDENISKIALPVEGDSSDTNTSDLTDEKTKKNEEKIDEPIIKSGESTNDVETTKNTQENNIQNVSKDEEPTGIAEDKETIVEPVTEKENVKEPLKSTEEGVGGLESVNQNVKIGMETPKNGHEDRKTDNVEKLAETDEEIKKLENSKPEEAKTAERKEVEEKHSIKEEKLESETRETVQPDGNKETVSPRTDKETVEPTMENQITPTEEPKPAENAERKEKQTEEEVCDKENGQKTETQILDTQSAMIEKNEPEELCGVVDVQNIPEKAENEIKEQKTNQEELHMEEGDKNIQEDMRDENRNAEKTQETETNQEELCAVVDVKNIPKQDENATRKAENEFQNREEPEQSDAVDPKHTPEEKTENETVENEKKVEITENKEPETSPDELCTVVDVKNQATPTENKTENEKQETAEEIEEKNNQEELHTVEDVEIPKEDTIGEPKAEKTDANAVKEEKAQNEGGETNQEELCTVVDVENIPKDNNTNESKTEKEAAEIQIEESPSVDNNKQKEDTVDDSKTEAKPEMIDVEPPHIIEPGKAEAVQPPEEFQIKTIQTHYYDTLQVPETVTKEYIVHNVATPPLNSLLGAADLLQPKIDDTMSAPPPIGFMESITVSPPFEKQTEADMPDVQNQQEVESNTQISDSDDLLDIMTPTSGYSLNLSEISWQTVNGMFLDSERRFSSREKEEVRFTTPKSVDQSRPEVEEVIHKTVIPTNVDAVPIPPREEEEINAEEVTPENVKEKKEEKPEGESDGSTESRSVDSDVPFISVEVKTVIETQVLDEEEEKDGERRHPSVEVTVEATIDIQDDVGRPQSERDTVEEENKISNRNNQQISDIKSSLEEFESTNQDDQPKESSSTEQITGKEEGSSGESYSTISSAPTEIKRTDSAKRNFSSARSLLSTQSLDLGKRNPLVKTRSLSTFRHGVTDFEVWSAIEKELEEAATKIQSKFRGYKTRKKLQRENAVQITTEESSPSTTPAEVEVKEEGQQSTGEFHDSIVLAEHPR